MSDQLPVKKTHAQIKAERLQAALRDNLRRRKAAGSEKPAADNGPEPDASDRA